MTKIMVVDDHAHTRMLLKEYLVEQDYDVVTASNGEQALTVFNFEQPDLILLDVMMPRLDGFSFIEQFRKHHRVPIILLTAKITEQDKVHGLDLGADDYITKPFGMQELLSRVRAVLRRTNGSSEGADVTTLQVGELHLNTVNRTVTLNSVPIVLTPSEFTLLELMMRHPGRVFPRQQLLEHLQGNDYDGVERTVDVHISNLRKKIEADTANPRYIQTVFGVGYRCNDADA